MSGSDDFAAPEIHYAFHRDKRYWFALLASKRMFNNHLDVLIGHLFYVDKEKLNGQ